ncbi:MAG: TonB-dependent receptor domain-containing protein [Chitinophagaceae bacterium]
MQKLLFSILLFLSVHVNAQIPGGGRPVGGQNMNMGRFYGRIVDGKTNKSLEAASVQLIQNKMDTATKKRKDVVVSGQLTKGNGDFSLENLPIMGQFKLKISAIGYLPLEQSVKFDINMNGGDFSKMLNNIDVDLGKIKLEIDAKQLEEVKVVGTKPFMQMGVDRKVFNVEKNLVSTGQTASEMMKNIPGVDVDIDGNVTLRNASPTIFVDGRPTNLTLDQIPSDAIQSVELITNPSAKFDASGGMSGIINIILKKNRKAGYNGSLRTGIDSRGMPNAGGDINIKQGKVNIFASSMYNRRKSIGEGQSLREEFFASPNISYDQSNNPISTGFFNFNRAGLDFFADNRNTFTLSGSYVQGEFNNSDKLAIQTDTLYPTGTKSILSERVTGSSFNFNNYGAALGYKHLFSKKGMELTADLNYNNSINKSNGGFQTQYYDINNSPKGNLIDQTQQGKGSNSFYTFQTDFTNPLGEKAKLELGLRGAIRDFQSENLNYIYNFALNQYIPITSINANYKFNDKVFAVYGTYANTIGKKTNYQLGLRVESSTYTGTLLTNGNTFGNSYPMSLFPSLNFTHQIDQTQDLQFSYARKINRPNFFQILPFVDYTDSLNISRGNPDLIPEFTNSLELNYQKSFKKSHSVFISAYFKQTDNLITRYQIKEESTTPGKDILINTFINANSSRAYGLELTSRNPVTKWLEITTNLNFFNSSINSSNLQVDLNNSLWSFFGKINANIKLPSNFTLQLAGDYRSKTILPQSSSNRGGGGGGGWGGGGGGGWGGFVQTSAQGYIEPNYGIEFALRKDFLKEKKGSLTLSMNDVFKTKVFGSYSESQFFTQTNSRRRDWQVLRLNFSYRFGKVDASIFKRKNTRSGSDGMQEGMQMQQ